MTKAEAALDAFVHGRMSLGAAYRIAHPEHSGPVPPEVGLAVMKA